MAAWILPGLCFGEEAGARNLAFFRVKWLQPAMKGTCVCGGCGCGRSGRDGFLLCVLQRVVVSACVVLCVSWKSVVEDRIGMAAWLLSSGVAMRVERDAGLLGDAAKRIVMAAWILPGLCFGEEAGARNLAFFRVKWLQPAMKGTCVCGRCGCGRSGRDGFLLCVLQRAVVSACVVLCVSWKSVVEGRIGMAAWLLSSGVAMRVERFMFATGCCETYCNGCMNFAWALFWGGSRSTKPCIFPCKVVAAGDERYLVRAVDAAAVVPDAMGSSSVFCNERLCLCA